MNRQQKEDKLSQRTLEAAAEYLKHQGWAPAVISLRRIQRQAGGLSHNFELVIAFTGTSPRGADLAEMPEVVVEAHLVEDQEDR
jgi:hypothetical protein